MVLFAAARRWRATSKQATAPATPTLSDGSAPCWGMAADRVAASAHERRQPLLLARPPRARPGRRRAAGRRATGRPRRPARSTTRRARVARSGRPVPRPRRRRSRCSIAPAAVLVTVGDRRAERWRGRTTPVTPAHSALRRSAPRLRGSVMPAATSRNGGPPCRSGRAEVRERDRIEGAGQRDDALGRLGAGLSVEAGAGDRLDRDAASCGELLYAIELRRGVLVLGHQDPTDACVGRPRAARARRDGPRPGRRRAR